MNKPTKENTNMNEPTQPAGSDAPRGPSPATETSTELSRPSVEPQKPDTLAEIHRAFVGVQIALDQAKHGLTENNPDKIRQHYATFLERLKKAHTALAEQIQNLPEWE